MPRKYVSKNLRSQWSSEDLKAAAQEVQDKKSSLRKIAKKYSIPERTLRRRIQKNNLEKMKLGRKSSLGDENEAELVNYIKKLSSVGCPLTRSEVQMLAFEYVIRNGISHRFNMKKRKAGYDWLGSFLKRHPELSIYQNQIFATDIADESVEEICIDGAGLEQGDNPINETLDDGRISSILADNTNIK